MDVRFLLMLLFICCVKCTNVLLGGDDHDYKPHKKVILGGDDHDYKPHKKVHLGGDDHDYKPHKKVILGGDDHDYKPHTKVLLGGDDHDYKPHKKVLLGGDDHDYKPHKVLLGGDDHDYKPHKKNGRSLFHSFLLSSFKDLTHKQSLTKQHSKSDTKCCPGHCCQDLTHAVKNYLRKKHLGKKQLNHIGLKNLSHVKEFEAFLRKHSHKYDSAAEYRQRHHIFVDNLRKVRLFQSNDLGSAKYGITKFSDITETEFRKMLGFRPEMKPMLSSMTSATIPNITLPAEADWRKQGAVTPVKNQGMCGSCWAFSTTGNIEGQWAIKHSHLYSLSEQELVDCDKSDQGCEGGLPENAYKAIEDLGGLETEDDYPYDAADESCSIRPEKFKVKVKGSLDLPKNEDDMAKWLVKNGPISIGINANALQFYTGGVSHPISFLCSKSGIDHGVLIVGYGVHVTKYLHRVQPYWIVKNSWGSDWGERGYFRVYRGDGTCGLNELATSAIV